LLFLTHVIGEKRFKMAVTKYKPTHEEKRSNMNWKEHNKLIDLKNSVIEKLEGLTYTSTKEKLLVDHIIEQIKDNEIFSIEVIKELIE